MRITDVDAIPVRVGQRNQLLVRIATDDGLVGWGESGLSTRELAVKGAVEHYRGVLVGADPMRRGALWQTLYRSQYFEGGRVLTAAISAIDIALHDLVGKALGVPVYELLGGRQRDHVPCFATTQADTGPELVEDVVKLVEAGWSSVRVMALSEPGEMQAGTYEPRESLGMTAEWVRRAREEVGPSPMLGVEYHHRLSVAEAARFCQMLPPGTIDYLEEPIRAESPDAYSALRRLTDVPFAIGEEFSSKWAFVPFIERGLVEFVRLDICNVGGFTEAMKVVGWSEAHYQEVMPHNPLGPICLAASAHLAMATPNFAFLEIRESPVEDLGFYDASIFPSQPTRHRDRIILDEEPGLGVTVDESKLDTTFVETPGPILHRRDGSITNW